MVNSTPSTYIAIPHQDRTRTTVFRLVYEGGITTLPGVNGSCHLGEEEEFCRSWMMRKTPYLPSSDPPLSHTYTTPYLFYDLVVNRENPWNGDFTDTWMNPCLQEKWMDIFSLSPDERAALLEYLTTC